MAIIYTYPQKSTLSLSDAVLITDNSSVDPAKRTKQATVLALKNAISGGSTTVNSVTAFTTSDFGKEGIVTTPTSGAVKVGINILPLTDLSSGAIGSDLLFVVDDPSGIPKNKKISIDNFFSTAGLVTNSSINYTVKLPNAVGTANQVLKLPAVIGDNPQQLAWSDAGGTGGFETFPFTTANGYITTDGTYIMQMIAPSDCAPTNFKFYMNLAQLSERTTAVAIYKGDISSNGSLQSKGQIFGASPEKRITEGTLAAESGATAISAGDSILVCFSMDTNVSPLSVIPITASGSITLTNASPISNDKLALYDTTSIDASEFPATISALQTLLSGATPTTSRPFLFIY